MRGVGLLAIVCSISLPDILAAFPETQRRRSQVHSESAFLLSSPLTPDFPVLTCAQGKRFRDGLTLTQRTKSMYFQLLHHRESSRCRAVPSLLQVRTAAIPQLTIETAIWCYSMAV